MKETTLCNLYDCIYCDKKSCSSVIMYGIANVEVVCDICKGRWAYSYPVNYIYGYPKIREGKRDGILTVAQVERYCEKEVEKR